MLGILIAIVCVAAICLIGCLIDDPKRDKLSPGAMIGALAAVAILGLAFTSFPTEIKIHKSDVAKTCFPYVVTHYQHDAHTAVFDCGNDGKLRWATKK